MRELTQDMDAVGDTSDCGDAVANVLLTGAGFSRNWDGWLATEAFEYLIGCPEVDVHLRHLLWQHKSRGGGFEDALAELQLEVSRTARESTKKQLDDLQAAIIGMFNAMDQAFGTVKFEQSNDLAYLERTFLARFDAIFTLNQDLLLERYYLDDNISLGHPRRWSGWQIPGTKLLGPTTHVHDPVLIRTAMRAPDDGLNFKEHPGLQPYYSYMDRRTGRAAAGVADG